MKHKTATGHVCKASVSKGSSNVALYNTTSSIKHLDKFHVTDHQELLRAQTVKQTVSWRQYREEGHLGCNRLHLGVLLTEVRCLRGANASCYSLQLGAAIVKWAESWTVFMFWQTRMALAWIHSEVGGLDMSDKSLCSIETKKGLGCVQCVAQFGCNVQNEDNQQKSSAFEYDICSLIF